MGKRKRSHPLDRDHKRAKVENKTITPVKHPVLSLYYRNVLTLRDYLLSNLPGTSKVRRRKIASILPDTSSPHHGDQGTNPLSQNDHRLSKLLHNTLVCTVHEQTPRTDCSRARDFEAFSQHVTSTAGSSIASSISLSDLVEHAIWRLFYKIHRHVHRPPHLICHGFQRVGNPRKNNVDHCAVAGIPGIVSYYPNSNVNVLKGPGWREILALLGDEGDRMILDLLLDCGIFIKGYEDQDNYYQLSGNHY